MLENIKNTITKIKQTKPLILNITNDVTMDFVANGLLSLGASPVMSKAQEEMQDLITLANCIVINPGTLDEKFISLCKIVCRIANEKQKPIVLDPVGAGASQYRTQANLEIVNNFAIAIVRGNASEVMALAEEKITTKGVDSVMQSEFAIENAQKLSKNFHAAILVSGKTDMIVENDKVEKFNYGSSLMPQVTGTGCLFSAVVAAFRAIEKNRFDACAQAAVFYGMCGEAAAKDAQGPASFKTKFLDALNSPEKILL